MNCACGHLEHPEEFCWCGCSLSEPDTDSVGHEELAAYYRTCHMKRLLDQVSIGH